MNAERLHAVLRAVKAEFDSFGVGSNLDALTNGLQNLSNQPADSGAQQQISAARTALLQLQQAPSNAWPSADRQILDQLGLEEVMGSQLSTQIEEVLARNEMTPAAALDEIMPIS